MERIINKNNDDRWMIGKVKGNAKFITNAGLKELMEYRRNVAVFLLIL